MAVFDRPGNVVKYRMWRSTALEPWWATLVLWLDAEPSLRRAILARLVRHPEISLARRARWPAPAPSPQ